MADELNHSTDSQFLSLPLEGERDLAGESMRRRIAARLFGEDLPPPRIGRFPVLETLGNGGMGIVYAAVDPELDRRVAIKQIRTWALSPKIRGRFAREARALARLAHPNVVHVYEVGIEEHALFIVMELVEGTTLKRWLEVSRPRAEILERFIAAGRGLAAAHEANIIHRDFKPANVLVGRDGRVRVVDFGLACGAGERSLSSTHQSTSGSTLDQLIDLQATRTGSSAGTPAYMSPEQALGGTLGPRSDQFSFCVSVYEALYGARPFKYTDFKLLGEGLKVRFPHRAVHRQERRIQRILRRGLALHPDDRYPSMTELLDDLEGAAATRPISSWVMPVAAGLAVAAVATTSIAMLRASCPDPNEAMAGIWDKARIGRLADRFAAAGAEDQFATVRVGLQGFVDQWAQANSAVCRATTEANWSELTQERANLCLDRRRRALRDLMDMFESDDPDIIRSANAQGAALGIPLTCSDPEWLAHELKPPQPEQRAAVEAVRDQITRAYLLRVAGRYDRAITLCEEAIRAAESVGYGPIRIEARIALALLLQWTNRSAEAVEILHDELPKTERYYHHRARFDIYINLADYLLRTNGDLDTAAEYVRVADAALEASPKDALARARLLDTHGLLLASRAAESGKAEELFRQAEEMLQEARRLRRNLFGSLSNVDTTGTLLRLANIASDHANNLANDAEAGPAAASRALTWRARAEGWYGEARRLRSDILGDDHPDLATIDYNLGAHYLESEELERSRTFLEHADALERRVFGPDTMLGARLDLAFTMLELADGRLEQAIARGEDALRWFTEAAYDEERKNSLVLLSEAYRGAERYEDSVRVHLQLLTLDFEPCDLIELHSHLATAYWKLNDKANSELQHRRLIGRIDASELADDDPLRALKPIAQARLDAEAAPELARQRLEEAEAQLTKAPEDADITVPRAALDELRSQLPAPT
ncbi:MAG: serine/threonine-protein kinase [Nannocystaceae bacterium]